MKITRHIVAIAAAASCCTAQATLYDRGGGMIYDSTLNITWLQDANYAKTSGYDIDGLMTHSEAVSWASNLSFGGFDDWRLPALHTGLSYCNSTNWSFTGGDCGFNSRTVFEGAVISEMAHMYYKNLWLKAYFDPNGLGITPTLDWGIYGNATSNGIDLSTFGQRDIGLLNNVQAFMYAIDRTNESGNHQWVFFTEHGEQSMVSSSSEAFAWAVRDGDVSSVPAPPAFILMLTGLGILGITRRSTHKASC